MSSQTWAADTHLWCRIRCLFCKSQFLKMGRCPLCLFFFLFCCGNWDTERMWEPYKYINSPTGTPPSSSHWWVFHCSCARLKPPGSEQHLWHHKHPSRRYATSLGSSLKPWVCCVGFELKSWHCLVLSKHTEEPGFRCWVGTSRDCPVLMSS